MKEIKFKEKYLVFLIALAFIMIGLYYSYAVFVTKQLQENIVSIKTISSDVSITYNNSNKVLINADTKNKYKFILNNNGNNDSYFEVFFKNSKEGIQLSVDKGEVKGIIKAHETKNLILNIFNSGDKDVEIVFIAKSSFNDDISLDVGYNYINTEANFDHSGANKPVIDNLSLIPVVYKITDEKNGVWQKADQNNQDSLWYSYENGIWANAVLVKDDAYYKYLYSETGTPIEDGDILGFYVWIPRFKYTILNSSNYTNYERLYNVSFEKGNMTTGTIRCEDRISDNSDSHLYSEICTDELYGKIYDNLSTYTHPAFKDKEGFWVSKFLMAEGNNNIKSIPNVPFLEKKVDEAINLSQSVVNNRSHLLTNMEYSSLAILTNSSYGKSSNDDYIKENNYSFKKIYVNSYIHNYTGCSSGYDKYSRNYSLNASDECILYNDLTNYSHISNSIKYPIGEVGPGASTTGTIYGVYDMVNATGELVSAYAASLDGTIKVFPSVYDVYSYNAYIGKITSSNNISNLYRYKLGDSIRENFRSFSLNGMWQGGMFEQTVSEGVLIRGGNGDIKNASLYTGSFVGYDYEAPFRVSIM